MNELTYKGIIIRQANYGDAHRMLWIFTENEGIIKAVRYGIRGKKTSNAAAFQLFSYGEFKLRPAQGEVMTAVSADIIEGFYPLSEDIKKLALVSYFADITHSALGEGNPDGNILSLFLNAVYAAAYRGKYLQKIKAVYELKLMCLAGFRPHLRGCGECGRYATHFSTTKGMLVCYKHRGVKDFRTVNELVSIMGYICRCEPKKMLTVDIEDEKMLEQLNRITEEYVSDMCEKEFDSLKYYYSLPDF